ncbi:BatD family protein [Salinicola aestuarinus]|uniref:BatD family protein n=1 Tax=Salinicola aestuarinus TaxID=1949082 RepID=UPI000DA1CEDF|nr:BatD family protein [Salinicola aestuarinus]
MNAGRRHRPPVAALLAASLLFGPGPPTVSLERLSITSAAAWAQAPLAPSADSSAPSREPQVSLTLTPAQVAPGERAELRITVLVPTFMPRPMVFPSLDQPNLRVELPERATMPLSRRLDGQTWAGVSRRYAVTPLAPGEFTLGEGALEITYQDPDTDETTVRAAALTPQTLIAAVPEAAAGLSPYLAGTALTLDQRVAVTRAPRPEAESNHGVPAEGAQGEEAMDEEATDEREPDGVPVALNLTEGEPVSLAIGDSLQRDIVLSLEGGSALLLPSLAESASPPPLMSHVASPILRETPTGGTRTERLTYIAQHGGMVTLPELIVRWYDLANQRIVSTRVAGVDLAIDGAPAESGSSSPSRFSGGELGLALALSVALLGALAGITRYWLWPRWRHAQQQRRRHRDSHGMAALTRLEQHVRARHYTESLRAWQALRRDVPALAAAHHRHIELCMAALGRERYAAQPGSKRSDAHWTALERALPPAAELRPPRNGTSLPPLNPRAVT